MVGGLVDLVVVGSTNTDIVIEARRLPVPGETMLAPGYAIFAGGKAANQALAAARAGAQVRFVGAVGSDQYGADRLADLQRAGVCTTGVARIEGAQSGLATIIVAENGENLIVNAAGANAELSVQAVEDAMVGHPASTLLMTLEPPLPTMRAAVEIARSQGSRIIANTAPFEAAALDVLNAADLLVCNEVEARQALSPTAWEHPELGARQLAERFDCSVVVTLGSGGCVVAGHQGSVSRVPGVSVRAIDTTGAGDAFCGVLATWLTSGASLLDACRAATAAGAISVTRRGAQSSMPERAEIEAMLRDQTNL